MPAQHIDRLEFMQQLRNRLQQGNGYTAQELAHHFRKSLRKVQRDLKALVEDGQVVVEDETAHTYRYRAAPDPDGVDPVFWGYVMQTMEQHVASVVPAKRLDAALKKLREHDGGARLGEDLFQVAPDTLPLLPAQFNPVVLSTILLALTTGKAIQVKYRYRSNQMGHRILHPQGAVQSGPRFFLYVLAGDETHRVRVYALHRFISAQILDEP